jgi:hypothetical protein
MNKTILRSISIFVIGLFLFTAIEVSAQNIFGGTKDFSSSIFLAESANLSQCANGGVGNPILACTNPNWENGNVNNSKAHWREGESAAYRQVLEGFTVGATVHTVTLAYDTTKGGKHALDYLTSFDRTETLGMGNNPCSGVTGCSLGTFTTFAIPIDPRVTAGFDQIPANGDDITQVPGVFTLFGGTITAVSSYTLSGTYAGDSTTSITVSFTAQSTNMVLAWGGHISTRAEWGQGNSAVFIGGSPYHMSQEACSFGCGGQNRALAASAVIAAASITIIKDSQPDSVINFNFSTTNLGGTNFVLIDDGVGTDNQTPNTPPFNNIFAFGAANTITVTEASSPNWVIPAGGITCVEVGGIANSTGNPGTQTATIIVEEGESVTCTFINQLTLASAVSVGGRVLNANGYGIPKTYVTAVSLQTGETSTVVTNPFGYYQFDGLVVGDYIVSVSSKGYVFIPDTRFISIDDNLFDLDFMASP